MTTSLTNLFADIPTAAASEQFIELMSRPGLRIVRIVLSGEATLVFEDEPAPRLLKVGDMIVIAPHRRHRVEATHSTVATIWLAVHYA